MQLQVSLQCGHLAALWTVVSAIFRGKEANSEFQRIVESFDKVIAIIHHAHHWSFTVINAIEEKVQMYDSMIKEGHKEANIKLKSSMEEILREEQQQEWTLEQMQVPQQTEEESCGYRMLHINKICNQENLEIIEDKKWLWKAIH